MSEIKVIGRARREFEPDICVVTLGVYAFGTSASEVSSKVTAETERLLTDLQGVGLDLKSLELNEDQVSRNYYQRDTKEEYESKRKIRFKTPVNIKLINEIRAIINSGYHRVSLETQYYVKKEEALRAQVLNSAIEDSRMKAEVLAKSMGYRITGIYNANLSGKFDYSNDIDDENTIGMGLGAGEGHPSELLKPPMIEFSAEVNINWLMELE